MSKRIKFVIKQFTASTALFHVDKAICIDGFDWRLTEYLLFATLGIFHAELSTQSNDS